MRMEQSNIFGAFQTHEQYQTRGREVWGEGKGQPNPCVSNNQITGFYRLWRKFQNDASHKWRNFIQSNRRRMSSTMTGSEGLGSEDHRQGCDQSSDHCKWHVGKRESCKAENEKILMCEWVTLSNVQNQIDCFMFQCRVYISNVIEAVNISFQYFVITRRAIW